MTGRTQNHIAFVFLVTLIAAVLSCEKQDKPDKPETFLDNSQQLILVTAESDSTCMAHLCTYNRTDVGWMPVFFNPVRIGKNGLGWGTGLHSENDIDPDDPVKREGDGKSPMGAFRLLHAYGYLPPDSVDTRFPYTQSDGDLICIDDVESEYYNMVVNLREKGLGPDSLPSHETMVRHDTLYRYAIVVAHNTDDRSGEALREGAGSCIFLHVRDGGVPHTAGCTAMMEPDMRRLLEWLDPGKNPVFVQLTRFNYKRLKESWGLPGYY